VPLHLQREKMIMNENDDGGNGGGATTRIAAFLQINATQTQACEIISSNVQRNG
jgi:hypothetical protein